MVHFHNFLGISISLWRSRALGILSVKFPQNVRTISVKFPYNRKISLNFRKFPLNFRIFFGNCVQFPYNFGIIIVGHLLVLKIVCGNADATEPFPLQSSLKSATCSQWMLVLEYKIKMGSIVSISFSTLRRTFGRFGHIFNMYGSSTIEWACFWEVVLNTRVSQEPQGQRLNSSLFLPSLRYSVSKVFRLPTSRGCTIFCIRTWPIWTETETALCELPAKRGSKRQ